MMSERNDQVIHDYASTMYNAAHMLEVFARGYSLDDATPEELAKADVYRKAADFLMSDLNTIDVVSSWCHVWDGDDVVDDEVEGYDYE